VDKSCVADATSKSLEQAKSLECPCVALGTAYVFDWFHTHAQQTHQQYVGNQDRISADEFYQSIVLVVGLL